MPRMRAAMVSLPILKVSMPQVLRIGCLAAVAFGAVLAAEGQIPSQKGPPPTAPPTAATQPPLGTWAIRESCKGTDCNVVFTAELFLERYSTADQIATLADAAADGPLRGGREDLSIARRTHVRHRNERPIPGHRARPRVCHGSAARRPLAHLGHGRWIGAARCQT